MAGLDLPEKPKGEGSTPDNNIKLGPVTIGGHYDSQSLQAGIDEKNI